MFIAIALLVGLSANAQTAKGAKTVTIVCSQGFQGPELWDKHELPIDAKGFITLFDGKTFAGWRGYGKTYVPSKWVIEDGCIKLDSQKKGEGGDIIFAHEFGNFELEMEWKISKGGNSGIFYLGKEETNADGGLEPIYISCPECQVLDNENHPDAKLGVDGNRKSTSLYDMIPAKPQNAKPFGEWNTAKITVFKGSVWHYQNGEEVLEYHLWTPKWKEMLDNSKFRADGEFPAAYGLLLNMGGENHEGYIGFQDHGDDVWYRNVRIKVRD